MTVGSLQQLRDSAPATRAETVLLRLRLIGPMEAATAAGRGVLPAGRKTRALLAIVALSAPRAVGREQLARLLWSRRPEEQARASLRQEIYRLQEALAPVGGPVLTTARDHLSLTAGTVWTDVGDLIRGVVEPGSIPPLDGELVTDLDSVDPNFDAWLAGKRDWLRAQARRVAEMLLRNPADPDYAISVAQRLLALDGAHEGAWRALIRAHEARGERGLAVAAYERCRAVLADMLDTVPSPETEHLLAMLRPRDPMAPSAAAGQPRQDGRARVGVRAFRVAGGGAAGTAFGLALAGEITAALALFRRLFVVSGGALDAVANAHEEALPQALGLDFLVDGTIQPSAGNVRGSLRLLDLRDGVRVLFARAFSCPADDPLAGQAAIAAEAAAQIDGEILLAESSATAGPTLPVGDARALVLRALPALARLEHASFVAAGRDLAEAGALLPDSAEPLAWRAFWHVLAVAQGWSATEQTAQHAAELARQAVLRDPQDAHALSVAGHVEAFLRHRLHEGAALQRRALRLNPNLPMAWALAAATHGWLGDLDAAANAYERYRRLAAVDPLAMIAGGFAAFVHLLRRDHERSLAIGRTLTQVNPGFIEGYPPYLAALGHLGCRREADAVRARLLALAPGFTIARFLRGSPPLPPAGRAHFIEGLRAAGIAERDGAGVPSPDILPG